VLAQARDDSGLLTLTPCAVQHFLDCQQELGDHVPVDAAEPFVFIERARAAREGLVVEHLLIQGEDPCAFLVWQAQLCKRVAQQRAVPEVGV